MTKRYNHCPKCNRWLGFLNFLKFWKRPKLCPKCEEETL